MKPETDDMVRSVKAMIKRCIMVSRLVVGRLRCSGRGGTTRDFYLRDYTYEGSENS